MKTSTITCAHLSLNKRCSYGCDPKEHISTRNWAVKRLKHKEPAPIRVSPGGRWQQSSMTCSISSVPGLSPHCPGDCRHHKGLSKALPLFSARTYSLKWPWLPMLCNSLPPCVLPAQQFVSPLGEPKSNSASQLDRLQESWELSIKPRRNSHTCREAQVQAPTMFAAWDTATPQLRFPVFNKCTGDIPIPDTLTPPVPHSEHCSEPPLRQTRQGHAIKPGP